MSMCRKALDSGVPSRVMVGARLADSLVWGIQVNWCLLQMDNGVWVGVGMLLPHWSISFFV